MPTTAETPFPIEELTATQFSTVEDKSEAGNVLVKFILDGFRRDRFTKKLYDILHLHLFSHIAHFNRIGFYEEWFSTSERQRRWLEYALSARAPGDPHYCWCDLECMIQDWLMEHYSEVMQVIRNNCLAEASRTDGERSRREALAGKRHQDFKVVAKSQNTNSFGLHQYILLAADGCAYAVCRSLMHPWQEGGVVSVPLGSDRLPRWETMGVELPERRSDAPPEIVKLAWGDTQRS